MNGRTFAAITAMVIALIMLGNINGQNAAFGKDRDKYGYKNPPYGKGRYRHYHGHAPGWANGPKGYGWRHWNNGRWCWDYKRRR